MDTKLTKSQQYVLAAAKKVNSLLSFMMRSLASRLKEILIPFCLDLWDIYGVLGPVQRFQVEERYGHTGASLAKGRRT